MLAVVIDHAPRSRLAADGAPGEHSMHKTVTNDFRHRNLFQNESVLDVRTPQVRLPDDSVLLVKPPIAGKFDFRAVNPYVPKLT